MKTSQATALLLRRAHLLNILVAAVMLFFLFGNNAKADSLLGVIGFHIVPMQMENTDKHLSEARSNSVDVNAAERNLVSKSKLKSVSHSQSIIRGNQRVEM